MEYKKFNNQYVIRIDKGEEICAKLKEVAQKENRTMKITISKTTEFEAVYLKVDAGVRYWEDAEVNGVSDSENPPTIPCAEFSLSCF